MFDSYTNPYVVAHAEENVRAAFIRKTYAHLAAAIMDLPRLRLRGLMCLPAIREDFEAQRLPFRRLRELADALRAAGMPVDTLSMGMSDDFRAAICEGSTIVRIGTAVFGPRS